MKRVMLIPNRLTKNYSITIFAVASLIMIFSFAPFQSYALNPCVDNPCPVGFSNDVTAGETNTILFRDINSLDNSSATVSFDKNTYLPGDTVTITINDFNANVDVNNIETITTTVNSTSSGASSVLFTLTETGIDTGVFVGSFGTTKGSTTATLLQVQKGDQISINYLTQPATARFTSELDDVTTTGTAEVSDFIVNDPSFASNNCFTPVVHPINFTLVGTTIGPSGYTVTISYANALLEPPVPAQDTQLLQMYYRPVGTNAWSLVTYNAFIDPSANNPDAMTITSDPVFFGGPPLTDSGLFAIGFDNGCGGGSGGGIVRSGFVLNFLAGINGVTTGNTVTPPSFGGGSLHYSDGLTLGLGNDDTETFDASKYNQELPKQVMVAGVPVNMKFKTFEAYNKNGVIHMGLYIIPRGQDMITSNSIASIVWEKGKDVEVNDPNHILSDSSASSNTDDKFQYTQFSFTPTKSYDKMSFLAKAWNDHLYPTDIRMHDAIETPDQLVSLPDGVITYDSFDSLATDIEKDGFSKPQILSHIHDTQSVFNSVPGKVYWLYDTRDHTVTLVLEDGNGKVIDMKLQHLVAEPIPIQQNYVLGDMIYSHHSLSRNNVNELEDTKSAEAIKALDLMTKLYGTDYLAQYDFLGKQ